MKTECATRSNKRIFRILISILTFSVLSALSFLPLGWAIVADLQDASSASPATSNVDPHQKVGTGLVQAPSLGAALEETDAQSLDELILLGKLAKRIDLDSNGNINQIDAYIYRDTVAFLDLNGDEKVDKEDVTTMEKMIGIAGRLKIHTYPMGEEEEGEYDPHTDPFAAAMELI